MNEILTNLYYDPTFGFSSFEKFSTRVRELYPQFKVKDIKDFYKNLEITQMNQKAVKKKGYKINGGELTFQIDLMFIDKKPYLVCVDVLTRKAYVYPLPNKNHTSILNGYHSFLNELSNEVVQFNGTEDYYSREYPLKVIADDGFGYKKFQDTNKRYDIVLDTQTAKDDHISGGNRLGIVDRFVRTMKGILNKIIYSSSTKINIPQTVQMIVDNYNSSPHSSLHKLTPNDYFATKALRYEMFNHNLEHNVALDKDVSINEGDTVRVYEQRKTFEKEAPMFSKEIYTVVERVGNKFRVGNEDGVLRRLFKVHELQYVNPKTIYRANPTHVRKEVQKEKKKQSIEQKEKREDINPMNIMVEKRNSDTGWW